MTPGIYDPELWLWIKLQNHPERHMNIIHNLSNTAIETTKNRCLGRESNSHLRVSKPPLYPLSYQVNRDWWWVYSIWVHEIFSRQLNACHGWLAVFQFYYRIILRGIWPRAEQILYIKQRRFLFSFICKFIHIVLQHAHHFAQRYDCCRILSLGVI